MWMIPFGFAVEPDELRYETYPGQVMLPEQVARAEEEALSEHRRMFAA